MNTVYKYKIGIVDKQELSMPEAGSIIHVGLDPLGEPCVWAEVDTDTPEEGFKVYVVGTGNPIPAEANEHVGSFVQGPFVWHV